MKFPNRLNPQAPVAQKNADEVVFRHFQGEGVEEFFCRISDEGVNRSGA